MITTNRGNIVTQKGFPCRAHDLIMTRSSVILLQPGLLRMQFRKINETRRRWKEPWSPVFREFHEVVCVLRQTYVTQDILIIKMFAPRRGGGSECTSGHIVSALCVPRGPVHLGIRRALHLPADYRPTFTSNIISRRKQDIHLKHT